MVSLVGASGDLHDRVGRELEGLVAESRATAEVPHRPASSTELAADLERLGNLHERGLLTDEEFADAKARAFGQDPKPTPAREPSPVPSQPVATSVPPPVSPPPPLTHSTSPAKSEGGFIALVKRYWQRRSKRGKIVTVAAAVVVGLVVLGAALPTGDDKAPSTTNTTTAAVEKPAPEETTTNETSNATIDKQTREYIAQVNTCQVTVGLTLLMIQRGETDSFKLSDSAKTAADTCEAIKTNLAVAATDHFDDEALLAWSGVSEMKSGMNAIVAYIDDPRPSKLLEARDKIQRGDAQAAEGIRQINQRRVVYGLKKIQS
jgi:hypothetical protein